MNRQGHPKTLIAAHPGNTNARKAGVFSPAALMPRIEEVDAAIAERLAEEVATDLLRRELASIAVLGEAMDASLESDGVRGRGGEPRSMINLRLRVNQKLRQTLEQYMQIARVAIPPTEAADTPATADELLAPETVIESVSFFHGKQSIDDLTPAEFDPQHFLRALILTTDRAVKGSDRIRARRRLTRHDDRRATFCTCWSTLKARDEIEFREWIEEAREVIPTANRNDPFFAASVRQLAQGEKPEIWLAWAKTVNAVDYVLAQGLSRAAAGVTAAPDTTSASDPAVGQFWKILLSPNEQVTVKDRLDAFDCLAEMEVFPRCVCPDEDLRLVELEADAKRAFVIRMVSQRHYRAAFVIARFPETYHAVRDAVDARLMKELSESTAQQPPTVEDEEP